MTPQQFDACTLEEREMILERRARLERERAISRPCALALAMQSEDSKALWMARARELVKERPELALSLKGLTAEVMNWCESNNFVRENGRPYAERTIYNYFKRSRIELVKEQVSSLG